MNKSQEFMSELNEADSWKSVSKNIDKAIKSLEPAANAAESLGGKDGDVSSELRSVIPALRRLKQKVEKK